jgi:hypothetical protein
MFAESLPIQPSGCSPDAPRDVLADAIEHARTIGRTSHFRSLGGYRERLNSIRHE